VNATAEQSASQQREWWLRTLAIFQSPQAVFTALRDDSREAAIARAEPITAIVLLAGMAGVLATSVAGGLLDDSRFDGVLVLVWAFIVGGLYALALYWLGGALLHIAGSLLGAHGSYRTTRHLLGFAAAPLVLLLLLVWPVRLAVYGGDVFRTGGGDTGTGDLLFEAAALGFAAWALLLLVIGMRAVHAWSLPRASAAVALAVAPIALLVVLSAL
jgi:hypothetical protein